MHYQNQIICGDALTVLRQLPDEIIQTVCTSPPYYGLRDYQTPPLLWDAPEKPCEHHWGDKLPAHHRGQVEQTKWKQAVAAGAGGNAGGGQCCQVCGAWRGSLGLEPTPDRYIQHLVQIFREVRRVLRNDGTLWVNIGDSYANDGKWGGTTGGKHVEALHGTPVGRTRRSTGLKPKDLMMIPARLALALQADGWWLRSDCIWFKTNCLPESVEDRPTKAHEYVFLLAKSPRYYYDAQAIAEPTANAGKIVSLGEKSFSKGQATGAGREPSGNGLADTYTVSGTRNKRSVWAIPTTAYPESHFAVMAPKVAQTCILAGSSPKACEQCGAAWKRLSIPTGHVNKREPAHAPYSTPTKVDSTGWKLTKTSTGQWRPTCSCKDNTGSGKCLALDPFMGAGTTAMVALQHGRAYIGIELNPEYVKLAEKRIATVQQNLWTVMGEEVAG